jgi:hypothetical protein
MPHHFTDRWLASVTFGAQWEEFTSLHHVVDWLATHGVRVSASTLYAMYYRCPPTGAPVGGHRARDWAENYATPRACTGL